MASAAPLVDRPTLKILAGGAQISGEYQIEAVRVGRSFNRIATAEILIYDGDPATQDFKASGSKDFLPGTDIEILAGYHGNDNSLFKGIVIRHGLHARSSGESYLQIECRDAAVKLTGGRKSAYYYDLKDSEIIEQIAKNGGLKSDVDVTNLKHPQMVQCRATDWDFLLMRAQANGLLVVTQDGKLVVKAPAASGNPVMTLTYGQNVLEFEAVLDARDEYVSVQATAWDSAGQAMLQEPAAAPSATSPGNLTASDVAKVMALDPLILGHAGQVANQELKAWANSEHLKSAFAKVRGRARVQGDATLVPGAVVELAGVGDRLNGKALISGVQHEINLANWETDITFGLSPENLAVLDWRVSEPPAAGLLPGVEGLHVGLVTALKGDPNGENRIQVRIPLIGAKEQGTWARVATLDAGKDRGSFFLPEIDDEVVLGFLGGDPRNPVVLGMLNSSAKPAPLQADDKNPQKGFITRSKITVLFDDDKKVLTIQTPGSNSLVLDDDQGTVTLTDKNGNKLLLDSNGITMESAKDLTIKASGDVKIDGTNITTSANSQLQAKGSSGAEFSSGGNTVLKGSMVQIN